MGIARISRGTGSSVVTHRFAVSLIVLISLLVGATWAAVLPPWDLNDEQQHVDYVRKLSETGVLPVLGEGKLAPEITDSIVQTDRWAKLHLRRPASTDPSTWGLEGESYQNYQPPLYYIVLVAPYRAFSQNVLVALYVLRASTVCLAVVSALVFYRFLSELTNGRSDLSLLGSLALVLVPERAQATSRVNNDITTELFGTVVLLLIVQQWKFGMTWRRSITIGLIVGLAILSKSSSVVLVGLIILGLLYSATEKSFTHRTRHLIVQMLIVLLVAGWQIRRNLLIYGDLTGAAAFLRLSEFQPTLHLPQSLLALGQGLWITRWQGIVPLIISIAIWSMLFVNAMGLIGTRRPHPLVALLLAASLLWAAPLVYGVATGLIQTVEGRFLLGAMGPLIAMAVLGATHALNQKRTRLYTGGLVATLAFANAATLVFFAMPYYYGIALITR